MRAPGSLGRPCDSVAPVISLPPCAGTRCGGNASPWGHPSACNATRVMGHLCKRRSPNLAYAGRRRPVGNSDADRVE
jgi:hypothetical protein